MKYLLCCLLLSMLFINCADNKIIDGKEYRPYGLLNQQENKSLEIYYKPCWPNIVLGCIFCETIFVPVYVFGFSMFEPASKKQVEEK